MDTPYRRCTVNTLPPFPQDNNPILKKCSQCPNSYPATTEYFSRQSRAKDGLRPACKVCTRADAKISNAARANERSQYYQDHKKQITEYKKKWQKEKKEQIRKQRKGYTEEHKNEKSEYDKEYYSQNKERVNKRNRAYFQTEKGRIVDKAHQHRRRSQKKAVGGFYTAQQLQDQLKRQKSRCYWCRKKLMKGKGSWHADHIVPLSKCGNNSIDNIVIACPSCNLKKGAKLVHEWAESGRLL